MFVVPGFLWQDGWWRTENSGSLTVSIPEKNSMPNTTYRMKGLFDLLLQRDESSS